MAKITLKEFLNGSEAFIQCDTEEQAKIYCDAMHQLGKKWRGGESFAECTFFEESGVWYKNTLQYSHEPKNNGGYTCYHFTDIIDFVAIYKPDPHQFRILRHSDYRWYDAVWDDKENKITVGKKSFSPTEIISIENDPRVKYVQCTKCGEVIKNTKKNIEEHLQLSQGSKGCLTCRSLYIGDETSIKETFTKNEDGTYTRTKKASCKLMCGYTYRNPLIDDAKARGGCRYRNCRADTIGPIDDFFIKYPGAFDDMATVDALDVGKWKVYYRGTGDDVTFKWNGRYSINVRTTNLGIIDRFVCSYRSNDHEIVYSKKYDKIFEISYGTYAELTASDSPFSETYYKELMKIIRNIYKGED